MTPLTRIVAVAIIVAGSGLVAIAPAASAAVRNADSDFNGDGYSDLVVTSPWDKASNGTGSGGIHVVPGSAAGIVPSKSKYFTFPEKFVGVVTYSADFDGDGFDDLAVSSEPGMVNGDGSAGDPYGYRGAVRVLYGSSSGLTTQGMQVLTPGVGAIPAIGHGLAQFGESLTAGDFDNDGFDDLAIDAPTTRADASEDSNVNSTVWIFSGSESGLSTSDPASLTANADGIGSPAGNGESLASGDFDGDGFSDLVLGQRSGGPVVTILPGSASGVTTTGQQEFSLADVGLDPESGSTGSLEVGDFGRSNHDDLAFGTQALSDNVVVLYGSDAGLTTVGRQLWSAANLSGISGGPVQARGGFGSALAAGDFGYSVYDDLAIGAPDDVVNKASNAGSVTVLIGSANGLIATYGKRWTQNSSGISGASESGDEFGQALRAGLFNKSSKAGLGISASMEAIGTKIQAGGVNVVYGASTGLTITGNSFLTQDTAGMTGVVEAKDLMGYSGSIPASPGGAG
jgi:hypothetical protein